MSTSPKTYLITGTNKGIGLALVGAILAKDPAAVVIATARASADATDLLALKETHAGRLELIKADVADEASVKAAADEIAALPIVKEHGIDFLVLNAGVCVGFGSTVSEIKAADLEDNLKVNLFGSMYSVQAFLPLVRAGRSKRINYVSSVAGSIGSAVHFAKPGDLGSYGVSKAAGNYYFANLARELEGEGIHVGLYMPGLVSTGLTSSFDLPMLSTDEAATLWYEQHIVAPLRPTGAFFNEQGVDIVW